MLSFISFWRAAAIVLSDLASSAYYAGKWAASYEAWITTDPFHGGVCVLITGSLGFERTVQFALDEEPYEITERLRATLEEWGSRAEGTRPIHRSDASPGQQATPWARTGPTSWMASEP
jgi:hypothetical protein